jgi:ribonuclease D
VSHAPTYFERKNLAIQKWGKASIRPQKLDKAFLNYRQRINYFNFDSVVVHPFHEEISNWKPSSLMLIRNRPTDNFDFKWITTEQELNLLALDLELEKVIAVDFENNQDNSYLAFNCLIQISTYENNFLVDALRLYSCIKKYLGPIFSSPNILKLILGSTDLSDLQRDYQIYCQGVVDLQEVYHYINPETYSIGFKNLVVTYLGKSIDKLPQVADWRVRPLCSDLEEYAVNDAKLLLHCWYLLLDESDLTLCTFARSKQNMQKLYQFPKVKNAISSWSLSIQGLPLSVKCIFNVKDQELLYTRLYDWRIQKSKNLDVLPTKLCNNDKLALLCRAKPTTVSNVHSLLPNSRKWPVDLITDLLKTITVCSMEFDEWGREPRGNEPVVGGPPPGECSDLECDFSPEDIVIEIPNDRFMGSPQQVENPVDRIGRNRRNHTKRTQLWHNRRTRNNSRVENNLPRVRYYRNKGLKHKARGIAFRSSR